MWRKTRLPHPVLPSSTDGGWVKTEGLYEPHWTTLLHASKSCLELISYGVAESASGARRLHFRAQTSASVRENVPVDSKIKMSHDQEALIE